MSTARRNFLTTLGTVAFGASLHAASRPSPAQTPVSPRPLFNPAEIRITRVQTFIISRAIVVKIETNVGVAGWGEASSNSPRQVTAMYIDRALSKQVIGKNPFDSDQLWNQMFWENHDHGPSGLLLYAIAGVDLAIWDIKGKILDLPVYQLLGGAFRKTVPSYCGIPLKGGKIPVEEAIDRAQKVVDLGFKIVKLRMQIREYNLNPNPDPTLEYYQKIRAALPSDVELFVDPNEGYTASRAISVGRALQDMGMKWLESPVPREANADLREVVANLDIPVLAGEKTYNRWEVRDLIVQGNPDVVQPDTIKAGGISEMRRMIDLASVFFKQVAPHNTKPTLGSAAALHCVCSASNFGPFLEYVELDTYGEVMSVVENPIKFADGMMHLPEDPGLGLIINEDRMKKLDQK